MHSKILDLCKVRVTVRSAPDNDGEKAYHAYISALSTVPSLKARPNRVGKHAARTVQGGARRPDDLPVWPGS